MSVGYTPNDDRCRRAWLAGFTAGRTGAHKIGCPHRLGTLRAKKWSEGVFAAVEAS